MPSMLTKYKLKILLLTFALFVITGCAKPSPNVGNPLISVPTPAQPGEQIGIAIPVTSAAEAQVTYEWDYSEGSILDGQGQSAIIYQAPDRPGQYTVRVKVTVDDTAFERSVFIKVGEARDEEVRVIITNTPTSDTRLQAATVTPTSTAGLTPPNVQIDTPFCTTVSEIPGNECEALVALYNSTDGPNWISKTKWLQTNTPCTWYGISCENGNVTAINLDRNNLQGTLPETIKALKRLKVLNLWLNQIRGDLPEWLGDLPELEQLNLYLNPVTGEIPESLLKLKLIGLDLNATQISGSIPAGLREMTTLTDLRLNSDLLTGEIPDLHKLDKLQTLIIGGSNEQRLTGSLTWLQDLTHLTWLTIGRHSGLEASEVITAVVPLSNTLKFLVLPDNRLRGPIPESLSQLTNLECLDLSNNQLTGFIPSSLTKLSALRDKSEPEGCKSAILVPDGLNLNDNALVAIEPDLRDFLNQKDSGWETTQRILPTENPPTNIPAGQVGFNPVDEAVYVYVPAGDFIMGSTEAQIAAAVEECRVFEPTCERAWFADETPAHTVMLDAFWIMQTEVTNEQYKKCMGADICKPPNNDVWEQDEFDQHPVRNVTWEQANAYAAWAGGRLPTEAEWEKAARGVDDRIYPWGNEWDGSRLNFCDNACEFNWKDQTTNDGYVGTAPVGSYPTGVSLYGAFDMAGNVGEWVADWYDATYYTNTPRQNPLGAGTGKERVVRGGSFALYRSDVRVTNRGAHPPTNDDNSFGFRLVYTTSSPA